MPPCLNDSKRSFKGDEPSPKGLGFCAHAEKAGTTKTGLNGMPWITEKNKKGVVRWAPVDTETERLSALFIDWWRGLSTGKNIMVIQKEGSYRIIKTVSSKKREVREEQWRQLAAEPNVVALVWSAMSIDAFEAFIGLLRQRKTHPQSVADLAKSYKKYFIKYRLLTDKDYTLNGLKVL